MKAREFWIQVEPTHCGDSGKTRFCTDFVTKRVDDIHVREVLPGSITLTREELRTAYNKTFANLPIGMNEFIALQEKFERELFGTGG